MTEVLTMFKLNHPRARRMALASLLALSFAATATMAVTAAPAAARAQAAKKKSKGFTVKLKGGTLTIAFTSAAWSSLSGGSADVGTATTPTAPATSTPTGSFSFPISGGTLNSLTGKGSVSAKGGFTIDRHLSLPGLFESSSSASAENPSASLGSSPSLVLSSANFTPSSVALFKLATTHVKALGNKHGVTLNKIPASLTPAGLQFFGDTFKAGETVATITIAAKG
jgi:hypothetical protein